MILKTENPLLLSYDNIRDFIFNEDPDDISKIGPFYVTLMILVSYVMFVKWIGPNLMKNRKPFQLKEILIVYNSLVVLINVIVTYKIASYTYPKIYLMCRPRSDFDADRHIRYVFKYAWFYYLSKYVDLLDTVFFVLRKKDRQISFLHVFHHTVIILLCYTGLYYKARGNYIALGLPMNSFVHICTYSYYALSAMGPKVQKYLWWKKHLTFIQVVQFFLAIICIIASVAFGCEQIDPVLLPLLGFTAILLFLFANFYVKNYKVKEK